MSSIDVLKTTQSCTITMVIKHVLLTTTSDHIFTNRSKCKCQFTHCSNWSTGQLNMLKIKSPTLRAPTINPVWKSFFCSLYLDINCSTCARCYRAWLDVNCLIVPCRAAVWKQLHSLCFSTHLFRFALIYHLSVFTVVKRVANIAPNQIKLRRVQTGFLITFLGSQWKKM